MSEIEALQEQVQRLVKVRDAQSEEILRWKQTCSGFDLQNQQQAEQIEQLEDGLEKAVEFAEFIEQGVIDNDEFPNLVKTYRNHFEQALAAQPQKENDEWM